jgi:hypothetical protein
MGRSMEGWVDGWMEMVTLRCYISLILALKVLLLNKELYFNSNVRLKE